MPLIDEGGDMGGTASVLAVLVGMAWADEPSEAPPPAEETAEQPRSEQPRSEHPQSEGPRFERPLSWRADRHLATAGLVVGYTGLAATFFGSAFEEPSPAGVALLGAGTGFGFTSSALLLAGTQGHARWLDDRGAPATEAGSWTGFGLATAGGAAGFMATSGVAQGNIEDGFLGYVSLGFGANALGVSVAQLYIQGDAMRAVERGPAAAASIPAGRWAHARGLGIAGATIGWATLPLWAVAGFVGDAKHAQGLAGAALVGGMAGAFVGAPLLAGGVAWERALLRGADASYWGAGAVPGYVLGPLGGVMMGIEMVGLLPGTFLVGMVLHPLGLGMLTAQLFIHERARGAHSDLGLGVVPWGTRDSAGLSITGRL